MQTTLWDKQILLFYLKPEESGWMFEIFGSQRASKNKELFITLNRDMYNSEDKTSIIEYLHMRIIKGKWHFGIPEVFKKNNIEVNFSKRGFYHPKHPILSKLETGKKLMEEPKMLLSYLYNRIR